MARIGIFGGTFNPPHLGHMAAVRQALEALKLDKLILIPDGQAPHKEMPSDSPEPEQRLEMVRLAAKGLPLAEVNDLEVRREGPSYTYQTLRQLRELYPKDRLFLLMGSDMFLSLNTWRKPEAICRLATPAVMLRGDKEEQEAIADQLRKVKKLGCHPVAVENAPVCISSTDLRRMLAFCCGEAYLVPEVLTYIREHGLYGTKEDNRNLPMDQLERRVISLLNPKRVPHVLGCRDTAAELAERFGADVTDAARAGMLHDVTKALGPELQLALCQHYGVALTPFAQGNPKILHQITGSVVAREIFGENEAVCRAIGWHTTGCAGMNTLDKILYIADYMEPTRDFPGVERLRDLTKKDLDAAVALGLQMTIDLLRTQKRAVSPDSLGALEELSKKENCK